MMKFLLIIFFTLLLWSCNANQKTMSINNNNGSKYENIEFFEERRLNLDIDLGDVLIINSMDGITELYGRLENPKYSRSAPIPVLENSNESFVVIKPNLKDIDYGDFEIKSIENNRNKLVINYREVVNDEYKVQKLMHPIVIIKVKLKPQSVRLNKVK